MSTVRHLTLTVATPVVLLAAALLLAACGTDGPTIDDPAGDPSGDWRLDSGTGPEGQIPIVEGHELTLSVDDDTWGGTAACNSYGATVEVDGNRLAISEVLQTEMACPADGVMESEAAYLDAFRQVTSFEELADGLVLRGDDVELIYEPQPPEPEAYITGTTWRLVTLVAGDGPDGAVSSAVGDAALVLRTDGTLEVDTGCLRFEASYELDGERLTVAGLPGLDVDCPQPEADQHDHVLAVLAQPVTVEHDRSDLRLTGADGRGLDLRAEG